MCVCVWTLVWSHTIIIACIFHAMLFSVAFPLFFFNFYFLWFANFFLNETKIMVVSFWRDMTALMVLFRITRVWKPSLSRVFVPCSHFPDSSAGTSRIHGVILFVQAKKGEIMCNSMSAWVINITIQSRHIYDVTIFNNWLSLWVIAHFGGCGMVFLFSWRART